MNEYLPDFQALLTNADTTFGSAAILIFCLLLMSSCWSASIAEKKVYNISINMALGICIPLIYPLVLLGMPQKKKSTAQTSTVKEINKEVHDEDDDLDLPLVETDHLV